MLRVDLDVGGGTTLTVLALHLKSQIGDYAADQQRIVQASIVRRLTLPWIAERRWFAVMGDLNADLGSPTLKRIQGWDDVQADLVQPVYARSGSTVLFTGERWSHRFEGRGLMIDHILLAPPLSKKVQAGEVVHGHAATVSDHWPVKVRVEVP